MASELTLKELEDLQKVPLTSCSAGLEGEAAEESTFVLRSVEEAAEESSMQEEGEVAKVMATLTPASPASPGGGLGAVMGAVGAAIVAGSEMVVAAGVLGGVLGGVLVGGLIFISKEWGRRADSTNREWGRRADSWERRVDGLMKGCAAASERDYR